VQAFAEQLRTMRLRLFGKQLGMASRLGCTDAAISYWESGGRLPSPKLIARLIGCLEQAGARPEEISGLLLAYRESVFSRREREVSVERYSGLATEQTV
jgi:transcriptional regulator with XRE-family HTH domain